MESNYKHGANRASTIRDVKRMKIGEHAREGW